MRVDTTLYEPQLKALDEIMKRNGLRYKAQAIRHAIDNCNRLEKAMNDEWPW